MKKFILTMAAVSALAVVSSSFAYAEGKVTYDIKNKSVKSETAEGKNLVCIYKDTGADVPADDDFVYIGEADAGKFFSATTAFLLKEGIAAEGTYIIQFDGDNNPSKFIIDAITAADGIPMKENAKVLNDDGTCNIAFTCDLALDTVTVYRSILVNNGSTTLGYSFGTAMSGNGTVKLGVQINEVDASYVDKLSVYLSTKTFDMNEKSISGEVKKNEKI